MTQMKQRINSFILWSGGIALALCAIPEVIQTIQQGYCPLSWGVLILWAYGEAALLSQVRNKVLILNYICNLICLTILIGYKIWS